jgi:hypothetical protein
MAVYKASGSKETLKPTRELISTPILAKKTLSTAISKNIANQPQLPTKKISYADILREKPGPQTPEASNTPWTLIKKKTTPLV